MPPLALSDAQMDAVLLAARPLRVADRDAFLQEAVPAAAPRPETAGPLRFQLRPRMSEQEAH